MKSLDILKIFFLLTLILSFVVLTIIYNYTLIWVNIVSFCSLSLVSLIQIFTFYKPENKFWVFKHFIPITQFIQGISFIALCLSFQQIGVWKYILVVSSVFFLINFVFIFIFFKKFLVPELKKLFLIHILAPCLVIFFLGIIPFAVNNQDLYNKFNLQSHQKTYEQYISGEKPYNTDQIPSF
jgi:hypothetical protein